MRDWLISYGSWALAPWGLLGMYVTGRKKTWGWLLALTTQVLWAAYAVGTRQYGFLVGTCSYAAVYLKNWITWRRADRDAAQAVERAMIETVYRVRCDGPCKRWLRNGRPAPSHWGPMYAEAFASREDAEQAMEQAGWTDGRCPADQEGS